MTDKHRELLAIAAEMHRISTATSALSDRVLKLADEMTDTPKRLGQCPGCGYNALYGGKPFHNERCPEAAQLRQNRGSGS